LAISHQRRLVGHSLVLLKLRERLTPYLLIGLLTLGTGLGSGLGSSEAGATTEHGPLAVQGHGLIGDCSAGVEMTVSINHRQLRPGESLIITLSAKNEGQTDCQYVDLASTKAGRATLGLCGAVTLAIFNSKGKNVWPGSRVEYCPFGRDLIFHVGQTIHARGQRDLFGANGMPVPPGKYTVEVAVRLRLSVVVG
jgi:hypothetical protein